MGRLLAILLIVLGAVAPASAQKMLSPTEFRDAMSAVLRKADPGLKIKPHDGASLDVEAADGMTAFLSLDHAYGEYLNDPSQKDIIIDRMKTVGLAGLHGTRAAGDVHEQLVALPRPTDYLRGMPIAAGFELVTRPLAGDLSIVLMMDSPQTLSPFSRQQLKATGMSEDQAFALASSNLRKRMGPVEREKLPGAQAWSAKSGLATGLLILSDFCPGDADRLVLVTDRENFIVGEVSDPAIESMRRGARNLIASGMSLSRTLIECRKGVWRAAPY